MSLVIEHNGATMRLIENRITIQQNGEAITAELPIWAAEVMVSNCDQIKQVDFTPESQALIFAALRKPNRVKPLALQFNPVTLSLPNRHAVQFCDDGVIKLFAPSGKRVEFQYKARINALIANIRHYKVTEV